MIALIGDRYWWMPRWLEWLPRIDIEGPAPAGGAGGDDAAKTALTGARGAGAYTDAGGGI